MLRIVLLLGVALFSMGCQKAVFNDLERRLQGTWYFTDAQHRGLDHLGGFHSVYSYYQGDLVTFYNDKKVIYEEANGDLLEGIWNLHQISGEEVQYVLSFALSDGQGEMVQYVWETQGLWGDHRLRVRGMTADYTFCYDLRRY